MKSFAKSQFKIVIPAIVVSGFLAAGCTDMATNSGDSNKRLPPATVNNAIVTENEIRIEAAASLESLELKKLRDAAAYARTEREIMMGAMERVLEEKLLELESAEQGISKEQLIDREIRRKIEEPTQAEINHVYELNRDRVNRPLEELTDSIIEFLKEMKENELREEFLGELGQKHKVVRNLEPFRFDVKTAGHPSMGQDNAPVKLALFSDFECPYCRDFAFTLMEIVKNYGDKVQLVFRQFPLTSIHPNAQRAAEASLCARDQERLWETHDVLFANQRLLTEENIIAKIEPLGLDREKFSECLASGRYKEEIREDIRAAATVGADSRPTLLINGIYMSGGQPYDLIAAIIEKELSVVNER